MQTKRLTTLIWLAILTAVIPLLALPLLLMKALIITLAVTIAVIGYTLFHERDEDEGGKTTVKTPPINQTAKADSNDDKTKSGLRGEQRPNDPVDIADPETDRFIATNSYERRRKNLNT